MSFTLSLLYMQVLQDFRRLVDAAVQQAQSFQAEMELLGDVPDEFLDDWTGELMKDPVTLPTSGVTLERSSIERHLAGTEQIDPYNRKPLTVEELRPNDELRERIEAFKQERKQRAASDDM